uniref:Histidinol dehydrogenaseic-like isoform X3 n=1 Tax=Rhizophora mucronata TaxID=61149 RepID=A0A2P2LML5_RHIMU
MFRFKLRSCESITTTTTTAFFNQINQNPHLHNAHTQASIYDNKYKTKFWLT